MMTNKFDKIMETLTEVDKKWWIGGFFVVVIIANTFLHGVG